MILTIVITLLALLSDGIALNFLLSDWLGLALAVHALAAGLVALTYRFFLSHSFQPVPWSFCLFILGLMFFIPILGLLISFFIVCSLYRYHETYHQYSDVLDDKFNLDRIKPIHSQYGAGGAIRKLLETDTAVAKRAQALFMLGQNKLADINPLMYELLPDSSDEIRLLAFNILEQQENTITQKLEHLFALLASDDLTPILQAQCQKNVAILYWELVYNHLISPEVQTSVLNKAQSYALAALQILNQDAAIWVLLGKIYRHLQRYTEAEAAWEQACKFKAFTIPLLPYFAELKYRAKDYQALRQYLDQSEALVDIARIAPVKRFWDTL